MIKKKLKLADKTVIHCKDTIELDKVESIIRSYGETWAKARFK